MPEHGDGADRGLLGGGAGALGMSALGHGRPWRHGPGPGEGLQEEQGCQEHL